jgi:hypothetical protein
MQRILLIVLALAVLGLAAWDCRLEWALYQAEVENRNRREEILLQKERIDAINSFLNEFGFVLEDKAPRKNRAGGGAAGRPPRAPGD